MRIDSGAARALLAFAARDGRRWSLERGAARFDGQPIALPSRPGLHVTGDWPEFDLGEWLTLRSPSGDGQRLSEWLGPVDVHLDTARVLGFEFTDVTARLQPLERAWRIDVSGPMAEGRVSVPVDFKAGEPLQLDMQRLLLKAAPKRGDAQAARETDPRDLPAIAVRAGDFAWQGRQFGRLQADVRKDPQGLRLTSLSAQSAAFGLTGTGTWLAEDTGSRTRLALEFSSTDLAAASRALGYRESVDATQARVRANLTWSGGPAEDALARMDGTLRLELEQGRLRGVKPGAGRMLGLISVVELPRRLSLDFRDVTEEGLTFDTVQGDFEIRAGNAHTQNLLLKGATVDIGVVGRTGLAAQDYEQTVVVSGSPSGPITMAGALAGGPVGAAGALLFSQLFKGQLQGLARIYYRVTGPWSESHGRTNFGHRRQFRRRGPRAGEASVTRVAAIQMVSSADVGLNLDGASRLLREARAQDARSWRCRKISRSWARRDARLAAAEDDGAGPIQDFLAAQARAHGLWLVGGTVPIKCRRRRACAPPAWCSTRRGQRVARYDKIHLFDVIPGNGEHYQESSSIEPGDTPVVVDTPFGRLGLSICYDLRFPELYRRLLDQGADCSSCPRRLPPPPGGRTGKCWCAPGPSRTSLSSWPRPGRLARQWPRDPRRIHDRRSLGRGAGAPVPRGSRRGGGRARPRAAGASAPAVAEHRRTAEATELHETRHAPHRTIRLGAVRRAVDPVRSARARPRRAAEPGGLDERTWSSVLGESWPHAVDYADLYFQYSRARSPGRWRTASSRPAAQHRAGRRRARGGRREDRFCLFRRDRAAGAARGSRRGARHRARHGCRRARCRHGSAQRGHALYLPLDPLATLADDDKVKLLEERRCARRAPLDPRVKQVMASLAARTRDDPGGAQRRHAGGRRAPAGAAECHRDRRARRPARAGLRAAAAGASPTPSSWRRGRWRDLAREAVRQALVNLEAVPAPAGTMTVVLGPGWPGILLHEAIGHGLEGDFNRKGTSAFAGRIGQRWRPPACTVVDDGTLAARRGSLNIDDEGTPDAVHDADRGRHPEGLHAGQAERAAHGRGAHRQRPARVLRAPADAAHDQHLHAGRRPHDPDEIIASVDEGPLLRSTSAAARWTSPPASSCSRPARPT